MTNDELSELLTGLTLGTLKIDLDVTKPNSGDYDKARVASEGRIEGIVRGDCVAHVRGTGVKKSVAVTRDQALQLLRVGARWTGPAQYAPPGVVAVRA